ncbi:energy transducer TonB [Adhaeribacter radiodurans]|uniref:Energy transducer TonB n=1 Tax=Adhaeribacter radiodurans TaxID=2745197 RepID=A0A7L7L977_9BACT|nr:energy transducer TonB [Adhaeribacter radiodurans]QMU29274.1 energy transducer TonB [Adhaeribacter radiodurans]
MKLLPAPDYSLDDIVFEGRHQAYGAFAIRKAYPQHVLKATTYMFAAVGLLIAAAHGGLLLNSDPLPITKSKKDIIQIETVILPKVKDRIMQQPITKQLKQVIPASATKRSVTTQIVPNETPVKESVPDQTLFAESEPGLQDALGEPGTDVIPAVVNSGSIAGSEIADSGTEIRDFVERMPEFPGGMKKMYEFIRQNLRYLNEARRLGLEGTVVVTFVIDKAGYISDIKVIKDVGGGTAEEAIRVIRSMKPWQPGRQNGQPVSVRFTLPLRFSLAL